MTSHVDAPAGARRRVATGEARVRALAADEAAWLAALPCALLVVLAAVWLGPPLGTALLAPPTIAWLDASEVWPEPTEQARYLIALTAPLLLAAATVALSRRPPNVRDDVVAALVTGLQWLGAAVIVACFVVQRATLFGPPYAWVPEPTVYFTDATLVAAGVIAVALLVAARSPAARARFAGWTRETRGRRVAASACAVLAAALFFLPAVHFEDNVGSLNEAVFLHLPFSMDESWAVLDGRTPLVDFVPQYSWLWPYLVALAMSVVGPSLGAFTIVTTLVSVAAMLSIFDLLRRLTHRSLVALLLFVPFVATSAFVMLGPLEDRYAVSNLPSMFPARYAGPLLLAWLLARHLDGVRPRSAWPLFLLAGLVTFNNVEFGVAATGATIAALLWADANPVAVRVRRVAVGLVAGSLAAVGLVAALTLARTGELPDVVTLFTFSRLLAAGGFAMLPMQPLFGVALVVFLSYVAAIGAATVRALRHDQDRTLTGLLVWSGVFGLGIGAYYMGRTHPQVLTNMFAAWALAVMLLTLVALRSYAGGRRRWPTPAVVACCFAFGLTACSVAQVPRPWTEVDRLQRDGGPVYGPPVGERFVAANTDPGEPVVILLHLGHRIAYDLGLDNVSPYAGSQSVFTFEQVQRTVQALLDAGGSRVFALDGDTSDGLELALRQMGFRLTVRDGELMRFDAPWAP